jgi:hypothetical protein
MKPRLLIALITGAGLVGIMLPVQSVSAWTPEECQQAPSPKPPDCQETTTTIAPTTTSAAPTSTSTPPTTASSTPTSTSDTTQPVTNATVPNQPPYGGGDVGTATNTGTPAELPHTGFTTFLVCIGLAFLIGGCLAIPFMRRPRREEW